MPAHRPELVVVAAVARNGAIGRDGGLAFHDSADQRHFRQATMGCPVIMGRKTWDSLPPRFRPLPGRRNLVLSRQPGWHAEGADAVPHLEDALALCADAPRVCVIGGAQLYVAALPLADVLELTEVHADLEGDTHFPPWDRALFREVRREHHHTVEGVAFDFVTYRRR